jgi:hypothetical protein
MRPLVLSAVLLTSGCVPEYPGEVVAAFHVIGALEENACGATAVPAIDPIVFDVEIRNDRGRGFWRQADAPVISGTFDDEDGEFAFRTTRQVPVIAPEPETGVRGCAVEQREEVSGTVTHVLVLADGAVADASPGPDAGTGEAPDGAAQPDTTAELTGESRVTFTPVPGSDCTAALAVAGGPFAALPCMIRYRLDGDERETF